MFSRSSLSHRRAMLLLAFCALCWSIAGVLTRRLDIVEGFEITFWRSFFCATAMFAILAWKRRVNPFATLAAMGWPGLFSGAMWAVMFTCFMLALTRTTVANALLVMSVAPLLAALFGRVVLRSRLRRIDWAATVLAGLGIAWMVRGGVSAEGKLGMAIAFAVPVANAINIVTLKRLQAQVDLAPAVLVGALLSCVVTFPMAWPLEAGGADLPILALLGSVQLAIPCFLMVRAVRHLAAHEVALIALLEVVLGPIWVWLGAGEAMPAATVQGGVVVLTALIANAAFAPADATGKRAAVVA